MPSWYAMPRDREPERVADGRAHAVGRDYQIRLQVAPVGKVQDAFW